MYEPRFSGSEQEGSSDVANEGRTSSEMEAESANISDFDAYLKRQADAFDKEELKSQMCLFYACLEESQKHNPHGPINYEAVKSSLKKKYPDFLKNGPKIDASDFPTFCEDIDISAYVPDDDDDDDDDL